MLALIAGAGQLPGAVVAALDRRPLVCALEGFVPEGLTPDITFRLETLGSLLLDLGTRGVTEVCLCGAIDRPVIDPAALDNETRPLIPILQAALAQGDDGALRVMIDLFERTGFTVRGAHEVASGLLPPLGVATQRAPREGHRTDAHHGEDVLAAMGAADLGQACVIRKGRTLEREDAAGTDAMLARLAFEGVVLPPRDDSEMFFDGNGLSARGRVWLNGVAENAHGAPGVGGVLFKAPKPGQDRRADLPTIGVHTALGAAMAGLDGIMIEHEGCIALELPRVIAILDHLGMFLWVRP